MVIGRTACSNGAGTKCRDNKGAYYWVRCFNFIGNGWIFINLSEGKEDQ